MGELKKDKSLTMYCIRQENKMIMINFCQKKWVKLGDTIDLIKKLYFQQWRNYKLTFGLSTPITLLRDSFQWPLWACPNKKRVNVFISPIIHSYGFSLCLIFNKYILPKRQLFFREFPTSISRLRGNCQTYTQTNF